MPISPDSLKNHPNIPKGMLDVVDTLIEREWDGSKAVIYIDDIMKMFLERDDTVLKRREAVYEKKYLDFEYLYEAIGWVVEYESPDRGESFKSYFKFKKK